MSVYPHYLLVFALELNISHRLDFCSGKRVLALTINDIEEVGVLTKLVYGQENILFDKNILVLDLIIKEQVALYLQ